MASFLFLALVQRIFIQCHVAVTWYKTVLELPQQHSVRQKRGPKDREENQSVKYRGKSVVRAFQQPYKAISGLLFAANL
jgi:hypothetical protein